MTETKWDQRIRRAAELATSYPFAAEGLRFYERVATFQKNFYGEIQKRLTGTHKISADRPLRDEFDLFLLLPEFSGFLSLIRQISPPALALVATELEREGPVGWQHRMERFWFQDSATTVSPGLMPSDDGVDTTGADNLLPWIFLQPYAEYLADHRELSQINGTPSACPVCGSKDFLAPLPSGRSTPTIGLVSRDLLRTYAARRALLSR